MEQKTSGELYRIYAIIVRGRDGIGNVKVRSFQLSGPSNEKEKESRFRNRLDHKGRNIAYCIMDARH